MSAWKIRSTLVGLSLAVGHWWRSQAHLYVLRFLYEFTHNYGVTIILLTMMIKLMFVPLQYKSYKSMKQMQVISAEGSGHSK